MIAQISLAQAHKLSRTMTGEQYAPAQRAQYVSRAIAIPRPQPFVSFTFKRPDGKRWAIFLIVATIVVSLAVCAVMAWRYFSVHEETDDAYTTGHLHPISARINDTVSQVLIDDNEHVKAGQLLVVLDPNDFAVRVQQAQTAMNTAKRQADAACVAISFASTAASGKSTAADANIANASASISKAQAAVVEAQAVVPEYQAQLQQRQAEQWRAQNDYQRFAVLAQEGAVPWQQRDAALRDYAVAQEATTAAQNAVRQATSRVDQAQQAVKIARSQLLQSQASVKDAEAAHTQTTENAEQYEVARSSISQAEAQLKDAQLQLSYTRIVSPIDGRIGKKSVEVGQRVQPGQQLMTIVSDDVWVVANFKETQLEHMRPGQKVEIKVDALPHKRFVGYVDSFSPGSGASFALLPPDNATGNFTKIVQRLPVKVRFDKNSLRGFEQLVVPGMSAVVTVSTES